MGLIPLSHFAYAGGFSIFPHVYPTARQAPLARATGLLTTLHQKDSLLIFNHCPYRRHDVPPKRGSGLPAWRGRPDFCQINVQYVAYSRQYCFLPVQAEV